MTNVAKFSRFVLPIGLVCALLVCAATGVLAFMLLAGDASQTTLAAMGTDFGRWLQELQQALFELYVTVMGEITTWVANAPAIQLSRQLWPSDGGVLALAQDAGAVQTGEGLGRLEQVSIVR